MIKVDLSPTRVHSSAITFILLLLSIILVKSFFSSVKTHDLLYQRQWLYYVRHAPCLWNYLPEDQLNFQSLWKVCCFCHVICSSGNSSSGLKESLFTLCIQVWKYVKWANGLSIHCLSFQSAFLCYFKSAQFGVKLVVGYFTTFVINNENLLAC